MRTFVHPDYRPGHGERETDRGITLGDDAARAYQVWHALYWERLDKAMRRAVEPLVNRTAVTLAMAKDDDLGRLITAATELAEALPLPDIYHGRHADYSVHQYRRIEWDAVCQLHQAGEAPQPAYVPAQQDDQCRHRRPFSAACDECDKDF
jgi:hypothetical protein